jgi:hypothetical protein
MVKCFGCDGKGRFSIIIATGPHGSENLKQDRIYIPNQSVREDIGKPMDVSSEVHFCPTCMRSIEDNFRATIMYLQAESGLLSVAPISDE